MFQLGDVGGGDQRAAVRRALLADQQPAPGPEDLDGVGQAAAQFEALAQPLLLAPDGGRDLAGGGAGPDVVAILCAGPQGGRRPAGLLAAVLLAPNPRPVRLDKRAAVHVVSVEAG